MSKKRPTESSWDSDEELLSDTTAGISAFPKNSELDLLTEEGELDEEALLGLDDGGNAAYTDDASHPMVTRQRSHSMQQDEQPIVEQAFVFEETDMGNLEDDLQTTDAGSEIPAAYGDEGIEEYPQEVYHPNGSDDATHDIHSESAIHGYSNDVIASSEGYEGDEAQGEEIYSHDESGQYPDVSGDAGHHEDQSNVELEYEQPVEHSDQVHLEYDVTEDQTSSGQVIAQQDEDVKEKRYESDSDSDDDSRNNRGRFTTERTGVISLQAVTEREAIPDTLEINEEQAAQIEEFMSDSKSQRGRGRGGRNNNGRGGRPSALNRLGNRPGAPGVRPPTAPPGPGRGAMPHRGGDMPRMGMMNPRFRPPSGPRGPGGPPPRGLMSPPMPPFGQGMRRGMPPPRGGPVMGGMFNPVFNAARGGRPPFPGPPQQHRGVGRFPGGPMPMLEPEAILEPMKQLLQRMRGPQPGDVMGLRMIGPPGGLRPGLDPGLMLRMEGRPPGPPGPPRMMRPPHPGHRQVAPPLPGNQGPQLLNMQQNQLRQANRERLPPHMRLGQLGPAPGQIPDLRSPFPGPPGNAVGPGNKKIFINPLFQQGGPSGLTRTVKMGVPVQQRRAKALLDRARQTQTRQITAVAVKRKSTGGDETTPKVVKTEVKEEFHERVVERKDPDDGQPRKITSLLEDQKRQRELIQRRKELARQKLADEKRKELEKRMKEGNKIESIVGRTTSSSSDKRTVEKSGDAASIQVLSRSVASRLGPPPSQTSVGQQQNMRGPRPPRFRGPTLQQMRSPPPQINPQFQQIRGKPPQLRSPQHQQPRPGQQQLRGLQPQIRSPSQQQLQQQLRGPPPRQVSSQPQQLRGPPPRQLRGPSPQQLRGPPPQVTRPAQQLRGPPPQVTGLAHQLRGPPPQVIGQAQQLRGPSAQQLRGPPPQMQARSIQQHQVSAPPPQQIGVAQVRSAPPPIIRGPPPQLQRAPSSQPSIRPPPVSGPPPSTYSFQAPRPAVLASAGFSAPPPQLPQQPSQQALSYVPQAAPIAQPPPQQVYGSHHYPPPPSTVASVVGSPGYSYAPQPLTQAPQQPSYSAPQQEYQLPAVQYSVASQPVQSQPPAAPVYQYGQAQAQTYSSVQYESQPPTTYTSPIYQGQQQQQQQQQPQYQPYQPPAQVQTIYTPPQDASSYQPQTDHYSAPQAIQTIQTITPQGSSRDVGERIQTIGQRIQPVTGGQMRSIIHNVTPPAQSSSSARSVSHRTPTLHISRAVMDGNVAVLPGSQKVIILNVPQQATRETLTRLCRHFGHVENVNLMRDQNKAVVQFEKGEQAAKCVSKCDQKCLHKTRLTVKLLPS